jgi:ribosomal protein S18 acetylase RimI-like enzyme
VTLRRATLADAPALHDIAARAYGGYVERLGRRPQPMRDDYAERVRAADVFVAEDDAGVAGLIVLVREAHRLVIENVAVDPDRQGTGIGRALMARAEQFARESGLDEVRLFTNVIMTRNQAIYRHLGYREDGRSIEADFQRVYFSKAVG